MAIDGQVCFHRRPFAIPVRSLKCTTGSLGPANGINKDMSGTMQTAANECLDLSHGLDLFLSLTEDTALLPVS